jgi:hypothetical protein
MPLELISNHTTSPEAAYRQSDCLSLTINADGICGTPVIWFNYELGEKEFDKGFVCETHRISNRVEKPA